MQPPVVSIVGSKKVGKTTLVVRLVEELTKRGYRVGTIKHDAHGFEIDREGKDSYRHFHAGAEATVIASEHKVALVRRLNEPLALDAIVAAYLGDLDLVITEGFKSQDKPKIEVFRKQHRPSLLCTPADGLIAVASDSQLSVGVPVLPLDDTAAIVDFIIERFLAHSSP